MDFFLKSDLVFSALISIFGASFPAKLLRSYLFSGFGAYCAFNAALYRNAVSYTGSFCGASDDINQRNRLGDNFPDIQRSRLMKMSSVPDLKRSQIPHLFQLWVEILYYGNCCLRRASTELVTSGWLLLSWEVSYGYSFCPFKISTVCLLFQVSHYFTSTIKLQWHIFHISVVILLHSRKMQIYANALDTINYVASVVF